MALKKETLEKIAGFLKVDPATFVADVQATEEKEFSVPEIITFTSEEITKRDEAKISEGKTIGKKEGESAGKEIAVKDIKKAFGIEFEGKDLDKLKTEITNKYSSGDQALKDQIKLLQSSVQEKENALKDANKKADDALFDAELIGQFPADRKSVEEGGFTDRELLTIIKTNLGFERTESGVLVKKGQEVLRDKTTTNPLPIGDALKGYFTDRKWLKETNGGPGGRGGNDGKGGKITKLSEAQKAWEADGKNTASAEFQAYVQGLTKENSEFDLRG